MPGVTSAGGRAVERLQSSLHGVGTLDPAERVQLHGRLAEMARQGPATRDLTPAVGLLHSFGLMTAPLPAPFGGRALGLEPETVPAAVGLLGDLGSADLALARLYEGHLNALHLVAVWGSPTQQNRIAAVVRDGCLLGVWGADDGASVRLDHGILEGAKRFCSGLGVVRVAVVPVQAAQPDGCDRQQLLLLGVADAARMDQAAWDMHGMEATASGRYRFDGCAVGAEELLGPVDVYTREPWFLGGVWRIAAAEIGGALGVVDAARDMLQARGRLQDPLQVARLGACLVALEAARAAACAAGAYAHGRIGRDRPERAAELSVMARLAAERAAEETLAAAGRAVGLAGYVSGCDLERRLRDLATYMRQINPDGLRHTIASGLLARKTPLSMTFDG